MEEGVGIDDRKESPSSSCHAEGVFLHQRSVVKTFLDQGKEDCLSGLPAARENEGVVESELVKHPMDCHPSNAGTLLGIVHECLYVFVDEGFESLLVCDQFNGLLLQERGGLRQHA